MDARISLPIASAAVASTSRPPLCARVSTLRSLRPVTRNRYQATIATATTFRAGKKVSDNATRSPERVRRSTITVKPMIHITVRSGGLSAPTNASRQICRVASMCAVIICSDRRRMVLITSTARMMTTM